jgi:O-antigen/teichoic acid export membrane protein
MGLRAETARALRWSAGTKALSQALSWAATIVVIRLLTPEDYGLMAMTMAFVALGQRFSEFGFSAAIIRAPTLSDGLISATIGLSIAVNLALYVFFFVMAPVISAYFGEEVIWTIRVAATIFLLAPLGMAYGALLARAMNFRRLSLIGEVATQIGSLISVGLALLGFGVWALVGGVVAVAASRSLLLVALATERYRPAWSFAAARAHLRFGGFIALQHVLRWLGNQIDVLILGRLLTAFDLGGYHVARTFTAMPNAKLGRLLGQLPLAAFARLQEQSEQLRRAMSTSLAMLLRVTVPTFLLLAAVAPEFVVVVLGERWAIITPLFTILALAMPLQIVLSVSEHALNAMDRPGLAASGNAILAAAIGTGAVIAAPSGLVAVAGAVAAAYVMTSLVILTIVGRYTGFGPIGLVQVVWRPLLAALVMTACVLATRNLLPIATPHWQALVLLLVVAAPAYLGPLLLIDRRGIRETLRFLRS